MKSEFYNMLKIIVIILVSVSLSGCITTYAINRISHASLPDYSYDEIEQLKKINPNPKEYYLLNVYSKTSEKPIFKPISVRYYSKNCKYKSEIEGWYGTEMVSSKLEIPVDTISEKHAQYRINIDHFLVNKDRYGKPCKFEIDSFILRVEISNPSYRSIYTSISISSLNKNEKNIIYFRKKDNTDESINNDQYILLESVKFQKGTT